MLSVNLPASKEQPEEKTSSILNGSACFKKMFMFLCIALFFLILNSSSQLFAETYVSGNISSNTTWTKSGSPYIINGAIEVYKYKELVTLTIEPGTVVKFGSSGGLRIGHNGSTVYYGALVAQGTAEEPITFTSSWAEPQPGSWTGIYFDNGANDSATIMDHCTVEYGGATNNANIYCYISNPKIYNSQIRYSSAYGIYFNSSTGRVEDSIIEDNSGIGVYLTGSSNAYILNNTIQNNSTGVYSNSSTPQARIWGNQIIGNSGPAINILPGNIHNVRSNYGSGNGSDFIRVRTGTIDKAQTLRKLDAEALPWVFVGTISVYKYKELVTLTIEPGTVVKFGSSGGLRIGHNGSTVYYGALVAQGTAEEPITFTSSWAEPQPGSWTGIYFDNGANDSATIMDHCTVEYGGATNNANIYCYISNPKIYNSQIRYSSAYGIYFNSSTGRVEDSIIEDNSGIGVYLTGSSNAYILNNTIQNNSTGVYSNSSTPQARIWGNQIIGNSGPAINILPGNIHNVRSNYGSGNESDFIRVRTGTIDKAQTLRKLDADALPWVFVGTISVYKYKEMVTLTIEPGTVVKFGSSGGLRIGHNGSTVYYGALVAQGTAEEPITFTSSWAEPQPGSWTGIYFDNGANDSATIMDHCIVEYGGATNNANIYCNNSNPKIYNSQIRYSSAYGISFNSSTGRAEDSIIEDNSWTGVYITGSSNAYILNNRIRNNSKNGILSDSSTPQPRIWGNQIIGNGYSAINILPGNIHNISDNYGTGNGSNFIRVRSGTLDKNATLHKLSETALPWVFAGAISVSKYKSLVTLTIEPGTIIKFGSGSGLEIGPSFYYYGALVAQGTVEEPITFTSLSADPQPGSWMGICFDNGAHDSTTIMEHCIVEYGGHTNNANIRCNHSKPTLQYNTIRNSSHSGIYISNEGCNGIPIRCNNLKDNYYGIYVYLNAQPIIENNNFLTNRNFGIYNAGATIVAENNWWGDADGPGYNGDAKYGSVDYTPFLTAESDCVNAPPTNSPPYIPKNPTPANNAVRVPVTADGSPIDVTLSWIGGDPNPWDVVVYDVYFGEDPATLTKIAENLGDTSYAVSGLEAGKTYYWQIVSRDDAQETGETTGPVWQFTTLGDPPDLEVSDISWDLTDPVAAGETFTFTAVVENTGTGPVVDSFQTVFRMDGSAISTKTVSQVIPVGGSVTLTCTWNATAGDHTIEVEADTADAVVESIGTNNVLSLSLPTVYDTTPPVLTGTVPADGAFVVEAATVSFTLNDAYGEIDDAVVIASIEVKNSTDETITGTVIESEDTFTFTPDTELPNDTYTVSLTAQDDSGNAAEFSFSFTFDDQAPNAPTLTGGSLLTGTLQVQPFENHSNVITISVSGTREDDTSVWINDAEKVNTGSGNWQVYLTLSQGSNTLEIYLRDNAGNQSDSIIVDVIVDSVAPAVLSVTPANSSFSNIVPESVTLTYQEETSGLDTSASILTVKDAASVGVTGEWTHPQAGELVFTPAAAFAEGTYSVEVVLTDLYENTGDAFVSSFVFDATAPAAPVVNDVTSPCYTATQQITGTKEAYADILINDVEVISDTSQTQWDYTVALVSGDNVISFKAKDRAGNISDATTVTIFYDDIPPLPITNLTAIGNGDGTTVDLSWTGYVDVHGDIDYYRIYQYSETFSDVTSMTILDTVDQGTFGYTVTGLTKGTTYWFAVVPVDLKGNADNTVSAVSAMPVDAVPPANISNLQVTSGEDSLVFSWDHSTSSDLDEYKVVFSGNTEDVILEETENQYEALSLSASTGYTFAIYAFDEDDNVSSGVSVNAATFLDNPVISSTEPHDGYVDLSWGAASPSDLVKNYRVYQSTTAGLTDIADMTYKLTASGTTAKVAGLTNHTPYYFAVTTVNISGGERTGVIPVEETPVPDEEGPAITGITFEGAAVTDGFNVSSAGNLTVTASDAAGISHVEFYINGALTRSDFSPPYTCYLNLFSMEDGVYTVLFKVYDTFGNFTEQTYTLNLALPAPAAPVISHPENNLLTNSTPVIVSGTAEKDSAITIYNNTMETAQATANATGFFSVVMEITEGENQIQATATNRGGESPLSAAIIVTLDTTLPQKPLNLAAQSKSGGQVKLIWQAPADTEVTGYNVYRSDAAFTETSEAFKLNTSLVTSLAYTDIPVSDGTYYYRVATVDTANNESELSDSATADSDNTPPSATAITYFPEGNVDPDTQTMAPGKVNIVLTVSEPLSATPFLSITPEGGVPMTVALTEVSDTEYSGQFEITDATQTATAWAVFSARDMVGNRGTQIDAGQSILIDTDGPAITRVMITPTEPVENDETDPVTVSVVIGLNEAVKEGTTPELYYRLTTTLPEAVAVGTLTEATPEGDEVQAWQGQFTLPANAGLADAETLSFEYQGQDLLDNISNAIACANAFQVYQGDLPPLEAPTGLMATALPGGEIYLAWNAVADAAGYQLYRQGPSDAELLAYGDALDDLDLEFTDTPTEEGTYYFAVASIREINSEQSLSGLSETVEVISDATAPPALTNFALELVGNGILATWDLPDNTDDIAYYCLYRSDAGEITSVSGLSPVVCHIPNDSDHVVDPNPSLTDHCYVVTSVDAAGNESAPSNYDYLNFTLLPVSSITVVQTDDEMPVVTWTHADNTGNVEDFDFSINSFDPERLSTKTYTDSGYTNDERTYTIIAVDQNEAQSPARSITLPVIHTNVEEDAVIYRGIMNSLSFHVENLTSKAVENIRLRVNVGGHSHISSVFDLGAGSETMVPVVIGGYNDLADISDLIVTTEITPNTGEKVKIIRTSDIDVADGALAIGILNEEFVRGGTGQVRFTLENTGEENIEVITALSQGTRVSSDIRFKLLDTDNNVLSVGRVKQSVGDSVLTLSSGPTIARIPAGETFTSAPVTLSVPSGAPDDLVIQLQIDHIYHHLDQSDEITMQGMGTTLDITLTDTSYYAEVTSILPETSIGDEPIVITGQAVERASELPMASVPVKLIISLNGFERSYELITDDAGQFSYTFTPNTNESGIYKVMALHPDLTDRTVQGQFVISSIAVSPTTVNMQIPKNYEHTFKLSATAGKGTSAANLRVVFAAEDQPDGTFMEGVHVTLPNPVDVGSAQKVYLPIEVWADNTAPRSGRLVFKVKSDETADDAWARVVVNLALVDAAPVLYYSPNYVETGLSQEEQVTETVKLENRGIAAMENIRLSLVNQDGGDMPDWVALNASADQGDLAVGEKRNINISFFPDATVSEGIYSFYLRVAADNHATRNIGIYVSVTQSGLGDAIFKVSDIYTGTPDANTGLPIQGLSGANIKLQNEVVESEVYYKTTDSLGEAFFEDLPTGNYKARIRANNHQEKIVRIWIKPGVTTNQEVFLEYNMVTVDWEVNEVELQDSYDIVLTAVYETNLPAAVVVAEPTSITLPDMEPGDTYAVEVTLTNHGLLRADNLNFVIPKSDAYFKFETLEIVPSSLDAKQKISIPYRVTCLTSYDDALESSGGATGCEPYWKQGTVEYEFCCANGHTTQKTASYWFKRIPSGCSYTATQTDSSSGGTDTVRLSIGGSGTTYSGSPSYSSVEGTKCYPKTEKEECETCKDKASEGNQSEPTGSHVNTKYRTYNRDELDLSVKTAKGNIEINRYYQDGQWYIGGENYNLIQQMPSNPESTDGDKDGEGMLWGTYTYNDPRAGDITTAIVKNGVAYKRPDDSFWIKTEYDGFGNIIDQKWEWDEPVVFKHKSYTITQTAEGNYLWKNKNGQYHEYSADGELQDSGDAGGGRTRYIYGLDGRIEGIADADGSQVVWFEYDTSGQLVFSRLSDGRQAEYIYTDGLLTRVVDVTGEETNYEYDANNRLAKVIDANGNEKNITYGDQDEVLSVKDQDGIGFEFEYDYDDYRNEYYARTKSTSGKIKEVWLDDEGRTKRVSVNGRIIQEIEIDGRNEIITDENGYETVKEYDEWDNLIKVTYPNTTTVVNEYEHEHNRLIKKTDENGVVTTYDYDAAGNLTTKTEALETDDERITEYTYDDYGNILTITVHGDSEDFVTTMTYDDLGNLSTIEDPELNLTQFTEHDIMGNVLTKIDANSKTWRYTYDDAGRLKSVTDPLTHTTSFEYDAVGNKVKETDARGIETLFEYDDRYNLIKVTQAIDAVAPENNPVTTFEYNSDNKMIRQQDPEGNEVIYEYDNEGHLLRTIDGNGNEINMEYSGVNGCSSCSGGGSGQLSRIVYPTFEKTFVYDKRGRKVSEDDILNAETTYRSLFRYDDVGNLVSKTDKEDKTTFYGYDNLNRLLHVFDPEAGETYYAYDDRDNLVSLTDAENQTTQFEYNRNNQLVKEIRPMLEETTYDYDPAGNLIEKIDAKDQKTTYVYDDAGRLEEINYFTASPDTVPAKTVTFTYDEIGNLTGYDDGTTSATYGYDDLYRKISESVNYGAFTKTNAYTYLKNGLKETYTGSDAITYGYLYDSNNQLTGVQVPNLGFITINEYNWNRPASMTLPGGTTKNFSYDPLMRIKQIEAKDPGQNVMLNYQYNYDKMDNITAKDTEHGAYAYEYDDLYRLTTVDNPVQDDEAFTYDLVGNRLTAADTTGDWTYNDNNELVTSAPSSSGTTGEATFDYDANGNMIQKTVDSVVTSYVYNIEDRLTQIWNGEVGTGSLTAEYYYDPFGRRLWKEVSGVRTYFHYADEGLVAEIDSAGTETKTYGYKPGSTWTTDPLFMKVGSEYYFYHNDHLGTPQKITAVNGTIVWDAKYSSFGEATIEVATVENNLRFPGQYYDSESGLHYNYYRFYEPKLGRYLRTDPIGVAAGCNLFLYTWNNPANLVDSFGLISETSKAVIKAVMDNPNLTAKQRTEIIRKIPDNLPNPDIHNPYITEEFPGDEIIKLVIAARAKCDWDKLADCVNEKVEQTDAKTCAHCLQFILSRGQDQEAGLECMSSTAIGVGECYTKYCELYYKD